MVVVVVAVAVVVSSSSGSGGGDSGSGSSGSGSGSEVKYKLYWHDVNFTYCQSVLTFLQHQIGMQKRPSWITINN